MHCSCPWTVHQVLDFFLKKKKKRPKTQMPNPNKHLKFSFGDDATRQGKATVQYPCNFDLKCSFGDDATRDSSRLLPLTLRISVILLLWSSSYCWDEVNNSSTQAVLEPFCTDNYKGITLPPCSPRCSLVGEGGNRTGHQLSCVRLVPLHFWLWIYASHT